MRMDTLEGRLQARAARALVVAAVLLLGGAGRAAAQFCSNCIYNSAAPQEAQMNIGTATIRGTLTVGTLNVVNLTLSGTATANLFAGSGASLTNINASALASGTVPSARVAGSYTGITAVGTVTAGAWQATAVAPAYGGTGADLSTAGTAGGLPYFSGSGVQGVITSPSGPRVLMSAGSGAKPVWTSSPTLTGQNFSAIPLTALANGTLQAGVQVQNSSLVSIDAAKVSGDISGGAAYLTVALPINNLAAGTLPTSIPASSITVTGVAPGFYGGPSYIAQFQVGTDGRLRVANQFPLVAYSTAIAPGTLPPGVLLPAGQVSAGTLANNVIASSVAASGVAAGSYGGAAKYLTAVVGIDGRLTSLAQADIALPPSQLSNGTLPGGVLVPAANVQAGSLGSSVIASSVAANGVHPGTYGSPTVSAQFTVGPDGRMTSVTQYAIPGASSFTALTNVDNDWSHAQTSQSSWTMTALSVNAAVTAGSFAGIGSGITQLTPANMLAGSLPSTVIASSMAARSVGDLQLTTTGITAGTYGAAYKTLTVTVDAQGRMTAASAQAVSVSTANITPGFNGASELVQMTAGAIYPAASGANITHITAANIDSGTLGAAVIASSVAAIIAPGTGGSTTVVPVITWHADGRIVSVSSAAITQLNTITGDANGSNSGGIVTVTVTSATGSSFSVTPTATFSANIVLANGYAQMSTAGNSFAFMNSAGSYWGNIENTSADLWSLGHRNAPSSALGTRDLSWGPGYAEAPGQLAVQGTLTAFSSATFKTTVGATSFVGPLTGNADTATKATNLAGGGTGRIPYQSASDTTVFLPAMGAGGIIVGNGTSVIPSTAALNGTSNQVVVTQTATAITLSLPQSIGTGSSPTFAGLTLSAALTAANGGTGLSSAGGTANRVLRTSDGTSFTTGQVIGPDVAVSTINLTNLNQSGASDGQVVTWDNSLSRWKPATPTSGVSASGVLQYWSTKFDTTGAAPVISTGNLYFGSANPSTGTTTNLPFSFTAPVTFSSDTIFSGLASSGTLVNPGTITQTKFFVAQATVTMTVNGTHDIEFLLNCAIGAGATAGSYGWSVLVDGAYPNFNSMAVQKGAVTCLGYGSASIMNCSFPFVLPRRIVTAGSHTFAVSLADGANDAITYPGNAFQSMTYPCQWWARELP